MATSAGLTRYSQKNDSWSYHTRAPSTQREQVSALPSDQANAIAFNAKGDLFVGTQCDGIAISRATEDYQKWTIVTGPVGVALTPTGRGLPTALINGLLVSKTGTVYAATSAGLAWSKDSGKTWQYLRGKDYAAKVKGRWGGAPRGWQEAPKTVMDNLLPEDYVTCVAEDAAGLIWLGFRQQGYAALDPKTFRVVFSGTKKSEGLPDDFVTCILPMPDFRPYIGTYGGGVARAKTAMKSPGAKMQAKAAMNKEEKTPALPASAKAPSAEQLRAMRKTVEALPSSKRAAAYLGQDWTTQGDAFGRYGRQIAMFCAMASPLDHDFGWYTSFVVEGRIGPNRTRDDGLRHWVHWLKTDNPRSLYDPVPGYRRQAEWDDHGEAYPMWHDGPDVWASVTVPKGVHRLSLYFFNKDGHDGPNRWRDYSVQLKTGPADPRGAERAPALASARVRDFWGGMYHRFVVTGPGKYQVKIGKNSSFNTIVSAVLVDSLAGPTPWLDDSWLPFMDQVPYQPPDDPTEPPILNETAQAARELWKALDNVQVRNSSPAVQTIYRLLAYRAASSAKAPDWLLSQWRWRMPLWTAADRKGFVETMARAKVERIKMKKEAQELLERIRKP